MINWVYIFLGNPIYKWLEGLISGVLVLLVLSVLKWLIRRRIKAHDQIPLQNTRLLVKNMLNRTPWIFILWIAAFIFLRFLTLTQTANKVVETITVIVILIQLGLWLVEIIEYWLIHRQVGPRGEAGTRKGPVAAIVILAKIIVWILVIILVLENIPGIHITTLIASLGIGGIAVGLALQKILADLFASLTISIDQPFVEGDTISVDQLSGEVEHIGLKSTRLRASTGEQLIFSNSDLLDSRIHNYKSMQNRLVSLNLNVTYDTSYKKLQKIPKIVKDIIEAQKKVTFNRAHFKGYDPSSLIIEVVYTINSYDYMSYMDIQQEINLEIFRQFKDEGINFAYPTQTIFVNQ